MCCVWDLNHIVDEMFCVERGALKHMSIYIYVEREALEHMSEEIESNHLPNIARIYPRKVK